MKAAICTAYGPPDVLQLREVEKPRPKADEILVRVHASTVNSSDWFIRSGIPNAPAFTRMMMKLMIGVRRPRRRILGLIVAGDVVEAGAGVTRFHVGDRVYAFTKFHLGGTPSTPACASRARWGSRRRACRSTRSRRFPTAVCWRSTTSAREA